MRDLTRKCCYEMAIPHSFPKHPQSSPHHRPPSHTPLLTHVPNIIHNCNPITKLKVAPSPSLTTPHFFTDYLHSPLQHLRLRCAKWHPPLNYKQQWWRLVSTHTTILINGDAEAPTTHQYRVSPPPLP